MLVCICEEAQKDTIFMNQVIRMFWEGDGRMVKIDRGCI